MTPRSLMTAKPKTLPSELLPKNVVLFAKELDGRLLARIQSSRETGWQERQCRHELSVASPY